LIEGFTDLNWKNFLNLGHDEVLGLDVGSSAVKIVQLRKQNDGYAVTAAGFTEIQNATKGDKSAREANIAKAIYDCLRLSRACTKLAVCGVCGPEVAVRYFKFPSLQPEEIDGAVMLEASQVCPFDINDSTVDYRLMPNGQNSVCGVFVAATNKLIERKSQLAKYASLNCVLMDVNGLALLNCASQYEKPKPGQAIAVLNIDSTYTTLAIMNDNLPFVRDIAYAGDNITEQIAAEQNVSRETITRILIGQANPNHLQLELGNSLAKACEKLVSDVTGTLRYYTSQEKSGTVEKIYVCGGFALAKGFVQMLTNKLTEKVVLLNPFDKIRCDAGKSCIDILQQNGPAMAIAAGLAMRSI
jgi:type IV pilus assembly protein PilM